MSAADEAAQRAAARVSWPGLKTTLAEAPDGEDLSDITTAEDRLAMMWALAASAWSLTGKPMPGYSRAEIPGRIHRAGDR